MSLPEGGEIERNLKTLWINHKHPDVRSLTMKEAWMLELIGTAIGDNNLAIRNYVEERLPKKPGVKYGKGYMTPHGIVNLESESTEALNWFWRKYLKGIEE